MKRLWLRPRWRILFHAIAGRHIRTKKSFVVAECKQRIVMHDELPARYRADDATDLWKSDFPRCGRCLKALRKKETPNG